MFETEPSHLRKRLTEDCGILVDSDIRRVDEVPIAVAVFSSASCTTPLSARSESRLVRGLSHTLPVSSNRLMILFIVVSVKGLCLNPFFLLYMRTAEMREQPEE